MRIAAHIGDAFTFPDGERHAADVVLHGEAAELVALDMEGEERLQVLCRAPRWTFAPAIIFEQKQGYLDIIDLQRQIVFDGTGQSVPPPHWRDACVAIRLDSALVLQVAEISTWSRSPGAVAPLLQRPLANSDVLRQVSAVALEGQPPRVFWGWGLRGVVTHHGMPGCWIDSVIPIAGNPIGELTRRSWNDGADLCGRYPNVSTAATA